MRDTRLALLAGLLACAACTGSAGAPTLLQVEITSHQDGDGVDGTFTLAGRAAGGTAEIAIDAGPWIAAPGEVWELSFDTSGWFEGWHTIQARVRNGTSQVSDRINVYCTNASAPPPPGPGPVRPPSGPPPADDGLVAHWTLDNGAAIDVTGNGCSGTVYGASPVPGVLAGALSFDGAGDLVAVPDDTAPPPDAIGELAYGTISVWFRYDAISNDGIPAESLPIFYFGSDVDTSSGAPSYDYASIYIAHGELVDPSRRQVYFTVVDDAEVVLCFDSTVTMESGRWYHYAVVIEPNGHRAYLDGAELTLTYNAGTDESSYAYLASVQRRDMLRIGYGLFGASGRWWHFNGRIDELRIYDRSLSAAEVALLAADAP